MSSAVKSLRASDISVLPYRVNKSFTFESSSLYSNDIIIYKGYYDTGSSLEDLFQEQINYFSIRQLYYGGFITSSIVNNSGSHYDNYQQSTAASGTFEYEVKNFPTQQRAEIRVISIPQSFYGERLKPKHFILESTNNTYYIVDDGNGNLYDISTLTEPYVVDGYVNEDYFEFIDVNELPLVGNVFYAHGIAVITNPDFLYIFPKDCTLSGGSAFYVANDCSINGLIAYFIPTSPTPTISVSPTTTPTNTPTVSVSISVTNTPTPTRTVTATPSLTPTVSPSLSAVPSITPTTTPSTTPNLTPSPSPTTFTWLSTISGYSRDFIACSINSTNPLYTSTNNIVIGVTRFFTDFVGGTPFAGNGGYYKVSRVQPTSSPAYAVIIDANGYAIGSVSVC